jgi:hypothetical protein
MPRNAWCLRKGNNSPRNKPQAGSACPVYCKIPVGRLRSMAAEPSTPAETPGALSDEPNFQGGALEGQGSKLSCSAAAQRVVRLQKLGDANPIHRPTVDDGERGEITSSRNPAAFAKRRARVLCASTSPVRRAQVLLARPDVDRGGKLPADAAAPVAAQHVDADVSVVTRARHLFALGQGRAQGRARARAAWHHGDGARLV